MRIQALALAAAALLSLAPSAQAAELVTGFDFSQWFGSAVLSTDGATFTNSLSGNYSNLDPTFNAGAESAAFGTLYFNGQFGSTNVAVGPGISSIFTSGGGSLVSNLNAPVLGGGLNPFDSHTILDDEGQAFTNFLSMTARDIVQIVFEARLTSVPVFGTNWELGFGGKTAAGNASVGIEVSTDALSWNALAPIVLGASDTKYTVALGPDPSDQLFVRMSLNGSSVQPILDNVSIAATLVAPEPGAGLLVLAALAGVACLRRRA